MNLSTFKKSEKSSEPHFLLFGHPVEHSWSPLMHNTALRHYNMSARYHAVDLNSRELIDLASHMNRDAFLGANITIPYKQMLMEYMDDIDSTAHQIGAINTIVKENYKLEGHNTDCDGFLAPLEDYYDVLEGTRAIIFGTGGASKAIITALKRVYVEEIVLVSRNPQRKHSFEGIEQVKLVSYHEWTSHAEEAALIVNATPLGMHPKTGESPVRDNEKQFLEDSVCYDIVYNPLETKFLKQAKSVDSPTIGGLEMLIHQGSESFRLWTGKPFPIQKVREALYEKIES